MDAFLRVLHTIQASLGAYSLYHSYVTITQLQKYEEKSEKAAEYSNVAEHQLHKTRTTQASGAIAILTSFVTSSAFVFLSISARTQLLFTVVNIVATLSARVHIANFWSGKSKVPFVGGFNDAIMKNAIIRQQLLYLAGSWVFTGLLSFGIYMTSAS